MFFPFLKWMSCSFGNGSIDFWHHVDFELFCYIWFSTLWSWKNFRIIILGCSPFISVETKYWRTFMVFDKGFCQQKCHGTFVSIYDSASWSKGYSASRKHHNHYQVWSGMMTIMTCFQPILWYQLGFRLPDMLRHHSLLQLLCITSFAPRTCIFDQYLLKCRL